MDCVILRNVNPDEIRLLGNDNDNEAHAVDNDCGRYVPGSVQQQVKSRWGTSDIDDVITNLRQLPPALNSRTYQNPAYSMYSVVIGNVLPCKKLWRLLFDIEYDHMSSHCCQSAIHKSIWLDTVGEGWGHIGRERKLHLHLVIVNVTWQSKEPLKYEMLWVREKGLFEFSTRPPNKTTKTSNNIFLYLMEYLHSIKEIRYLLLPVL
jgi:hypothetical protein